MNIDRLPPHSIEAEQGVLACIMLNPNDCLGTCVERVKCGFEAFYDLRHQIIYETMLDMFNDRQPIDTITLHQRLKDNQTLEQVGGHAYLTTLPEYTPSSANLDYYLGILLEKWLLRKAIRVCTSAVASIYEYEGEVEDLIDTLERDILAIRPSQRIASPPAKALAREAITTLERMYELQGATRGIPTGFADLDNMTSGLVPGEVYIVAGYPGSGKTSFAMNLAERSILETKCSVAVFSLEMSSVSLVTRFICSHSKVSMNSIKKGKLSDSDFQKLTNTAHRIGGSSIYFEDESDVSIYQLRAAARRLHQQHKLQLIVIDYLQLIGGAGGPRKPENRQQEVADISRGIKAISRELNVPVVALSQLNDDGKLRESRAIGQDADNVWILESQKCAPGSVAVPTTLKIVKARNGPVGAVELVFMKAFTRFESVSRVTAEDSPNYREAHND